MNLATMPTIKWTVRVHRWVWTYSFTDKGAVSWVDPFNGKNGSGYWKIEKGKLVTRWYASKTVEYWDLPLETKGATGKCHMAEGIYDIKAVTVGSIDAQPATTYTRTAASRAKFLERCSIATGRVQIAQLNFSAWLSSMSIAYGDAFEAHSKVIADVSKTDKLPEELLLGFALAFLGGGAGGVVGGVMKEFKANDFMTDAVKDLAKYAVRGPGAAALPVPTLPAVPASPLRWQNSVNEKVSKEMSFIAQNIDSWRTAMSSDDDAWDTWDAGFDPAAVIDDALTIDFPGGAVAIAALPEIDKADFQRNFEKGFLAGWIERFGSKVTDIDYARNAIIDTLSLYGKRIGLDQVDQLLNKHIPRTKNFSLFIPN